MNKVVYVLGAGFSHDAGMPKQEDILPFLFSEEFDSTKLKKHRNLIKEFLNTTFSIDCSNQKKLKAFKLEDIFTILDRAIVNREAFNKYTMQNIEELRISLSLCVSSVISQKSDDRTERSFYLKLAKAICLKRIMAKKGGDPFAFIVLNWDMVLDNAIFTARKNAKTKQMKECIIDYCCYTTPINMPDYDFHSIDVRPQGLFNIKVQKLHGSLNWLRCSNCGILYYKMGVKIATWKLKYSEECVYCETKTLNTVLVEPTYIKDLNNTHLKMVWHNSLLNLKDAGKIVFIGYSLPDADFEFRYLLKKGIREDAVIKVVLSKKDKNNKKVLDNYRAFFGSKINDKSFIFDGATKFLTKEFSFELNETT